MVYVDNGSHNYGRMKMSHMIADTHEELVTMANNIGVQQRWIQYPGTNKEHFDICQIKKSKAIELGAKQVTSKELVSIMKSKTTAP
jgi:glucan phosphoethanolaminetransferase (alkaline phosphatase superfamily)